MEPEPPAALLTRDLAGLARAAAKRGSGDLLPQITQGLPAKERPARNVAREMEVLVGKLNGAARDLVEAIDGTLPRDLEKRFSGGEEHVYTHRLYEARNQRVADAVGRRYGSEQLVHGRVDSYVRLFERLLDALSDSPQGESMVDSCLASESGKLYLALATAIGRIDPQG